MNHPIHHPKEPGGWGEPIAATEQQAPEGDNRRDRSRPEEQGAPSAESAQTRDRH
jgi:hypothetical protein